MSHERFFDPIIHDSYAAVCSVSNASELLNLCKVIICKTANENITESYNHSENEGERYVEAYYLEKIKGKRG